MAGSGAIGTALRAAVAEGVFPGAVLLARRGGQVAVQEAVGHRTLLPHPLPASLDTVYDLASLTKALATTTAVLLLLQRGLLGLSEPVERYLPELRGRPCGPASIFDLLNHRSGLPGWRPLYEGLHEEGRPLEPKSRRDRRLLELIGCEELVYPRGSRSVYSDLGFLLLGLTIERMSGRSLDDFCREEIFGRLGEAALGFRRVGAAPSESAAEELAATEQDPWRNRLLIGEVHDENAWILGGVAGHAGLFGTARAVASVTGAWLAGWQGRSDLLDRDLVRQFTSRRSETPGSSWGLGWDTPSVPSSSGRFFSSRAFGHLGFTGTSIWVDPEVELEVVLLSNRVHPTRRATGIQRFRPRIHDLVYEEVVGGAGGGRGISRRDPPTSPSPPGSDGP